MLSLYGRALQCEGFQAGRIVARIRSLANTAPATQRDFSLVRTPEEALKASALGSEQIIVIGSEVSCRGRFRRFIVIPSDFAYLSDGDIIGLNPQSGRFRTHYRRGSSHNSFLVTDRCNHYCLMCSQPPK